MNDKNGRHTRLRYTATGALAALAIGGAIAGTAALAAKPDAKTVSGATVANSTATKSPTPPVPGKAGAPDPGDQPFLTAVQRLVQNGTISAAEGQVVDRQIQAGRLDTQTLASSGFTPSQVQAVQQTLANTKRSLASHFAKPAPGANPSAPGASGKARAAGAGSDQPFLTAVQRLVNDGTISAAEGQVVDRQIQAGSLDTQTLASSGFTQSQLRAVQQTLVNTKRSL